MSGGPEVALATWKKKDVLTTGAHADLMLPCGSRSARSARAGPAAGWLRVIGAGSGPTDPCAAPQQQTKRQHAHTQKQV